MLSTLFLSSRRYRVNRYEDKYRVNRYEDKDCRDLESTSKVCGVEVKI